MLRMPPKITRTVVALLVVYVTLGVSVITGDAQEPVGIEFNRDIRPLLADKCFACHGPDANKREADLRLDDEQAAKATAIVAGQPEASELIRRITSDDPDQRMPPGSTGKSLTAAQIDTLQRWVAEGAGWQRHWSFIPPQAATPPELTASDQVRTEIDRFVQTELTRRKLSPAPTADPRTLMRRLSFDLTGLPPQPEQVDAFVAEPSDEAYEQLVDRLLASPHFGERMAIYWLDVVRYADSGGYHSDNHRDVALYRDYVIQSFNENLPFDQFTVEQLAGDLLPNATNRQKIASGYNRLLQTTQEGGAQPKEYTAKYQADRVRNAAVAWLGLTMGCCECHDHKFDPLSMKDFYSFAAFFADVQETPVGQQPQTSFATAEQEAELADIDQQLGKLRDELQRMTPELQASLVEWEQATRQELRDGQSPWMVLKPASVTSVNGQTLTIQEDLSVLATGENPNHDTYAIELRPAPSTITAIRLEALLDDSLANKSLSRANGNFVLTEVEVELLASGAEKPQRLKLKEAVADFSQDGFPIANAIDGKADTGWAVAGHQRRENRSAMFVLAEPLSLTEGAALTVRLKHESIHLKHHIGRFRLGVTSLSPPQLSDHGNLPSEIVRVLQIEREQRSEADQKALETHYLSITPTLASARMRVQEFEKRQQQIRAAFPQTLISVSVTPRTVRILPRGNWLDDSGEIVEPAFPASLPSTSLGERRMARLDFAHWMVDRDNPLTARVFVNRVWKLFFGQGLVSSLDDFGSQGTNPSHPELLDWLAVTFIEDGWDVKQLIKRMLMSHTYRQSSFVTPELRERDPNNRWLARQARYRLDAEMIRDNALAVSGLLSPKIGGPSVKPYQPAGYWQHLNFPMRTWQHDKDENLYRRGLYTYWQRTFLHPSLLAFDAPSREECTVERPRSNTPLQALVLLNDPTYVEAARSLASRLIQQGGETVPERLTYAFRIVLGRVPTSEEQQVLGHLLDQHLEQYRADPAAATQLVSVGELAVPESIEHTELAAWTSLTRVLLNLHETMMRY